MHLLRNLATLLGGLSLLSTLALLSPGVRVVRSVGDTASALQAAAADAAVCRADGAVVASADVISLNRSGCNDRSNL